MPAHINQGFFTDLLKFLLHKPLSLLGFKSSRKEIEKIKERKNIELSYFVERHYENLGIKDKKEQNPVNFIKQLFKLTKQSVNGEANIQLESTKKVGETIAPVLGITAFMATTLGIPIKLITKYLNKQNRIIDFFASLSMSAQQLIYFFKMVIFELNDYKRIKARLLDTEFIHKTNGNQLVEMKILLHKKQKLSILGLTTFLTSQINTLLKIFPNQNLYIETTIKIFDTLSGDLVSKFFSERRHVMGFGFRAENSELYSKEEKEIVEEKSIEDDIESQNGKKNVTIKAIPSPSTHTANDPSKFKYWGYLKTLLSICSGQEKELQVQKEYYQTRLPFWVTKPSEVASPKSGMCDSAAFEYK